MAAQLLWALQSAAVPILAIAMAVIVANMMKTPGKTISTDEEKFVITESRFWLVISGFGVITALIFVWLSSANRPGTSKYMAYFIIILCLVMSVMTFYVYMKHKIVVEEESITVHPWKGKTETFDAKTFGKLEIIQQPRCEEMILYNKNGKKLFKAEGYMVNAQLLKKYVKKYPIRVVKINNDEK